jgi:DNA-binding transcriptional ArsR family regulator
MLKSQLKVKKKEINRIFRNRIKRQIIELLVLDDGAYFGDLVRRINGSHPVILEHLMELKQMGWIYKDNEGGRFRISGDIPLEEGADNASSATEAIIEEINRFSGMTRQKNKPSGQDTSLNKLTPNEQRVDPAG